MFTMLIALGLLLAITLPLPFYVVRETLRTEHKVREWSAQGKWRTEPMP